MKIHYYKKYFLENKNVLKLAVIIIFTFISIQLINSISILSQFIQKEKNIIENIFNKEKDILLSSKNSEAYKKIISHYGININFKKKKDSYIKNKLLIIKDNKGKRFLIYKDYYKNNLITIEKNVDSIYLNIYKSIFLSSVIGILFISFGIIFSIAVIESLNFLIFQKKEKLKKRDLYLQILIYYSKNAILTINKSGIIESINEYGLGIFKESKEEKTISSLDIYQDKKKIIHLKDFAINLKKSKEAIIKKKRSIYIDYYMIPFQFKNEIKWILFVYNISHRKEIEKQQKTLIKKLNFLNEETKIMTYGLSHDIKAPLYSIRSLISIMLEDKKILKIPNHYNELNLILEKINALCHFIHNILNYLKTPYEIEEEKSVDVNILIKDILMLLKGDKKIKIYVQKNLPIIKKDPRKLSQIFQNLISNAIKYSNFENGKVYIECIERKKNWIFLIKNNGYGIKKIDFNEIFKPFKKLPYSKNNEGFGMGLSIVNKILIHWKEKIWLKSEENKGCQFFFTLKK